MMMMNKFNIRPWVGKDFAGGGVFKKRVLVLGESHYCSDVQEGKCPGCSATNMKAECHSQTEDVIEEFISDYRGDSYQQTFLAFERALAGREINEDERQQLWNSVVFYNYFQLDTTGARQAPNMEAKEMSEASFRQLLEELTPDTIIVWGVRLYDLLPGWDGKETILDVGEESTRVWHYTINGKDIPAMCVYHPSSPIGKSWPYWHQFCKAFVGEPEFVNK
ncbi:MAG: hypothetical protein IJ160_02180 [Muribaculaceae bacterium]|nr:hypothetical protein [Muribaculaceae bacterium]